MIAAHIENLLFLLLVAVAVLFQFLAKTAGKTGRKETKSTSTPRMAPPIPIKPRMSDEEQIRKLLEALGQPPTSKPPPPVAARTNIPPRPLAPVQPPMSLPKPPLFLPREQRRRREMIPKQGAPPPIVAGIEKIGPRKILAAPAFEIHEGSSPIASPAAVRAVEGLMQTTVKTSDLRTDITTLLASPSGLRDAIILREILGPPRGLRAIDLV
jgi:hypothetical protein